MLTLGLGRLNNKIDEAAGNRDLSRRDGATGHEFLCLADVKTAGVMRGLGDRQRIEGNRLFFQGTIAIGVDRAGAKDADVDFEAAIEHELLAVDGLNGDVVGSVISGRLIDFAGFDPGIDEGAQANAREIAWPARRDRSIKTRYLPLREADGLRQALAQKG